MNRVTITEQDLKQMMKDCDWGLKENFIKQLIEDSRTVDRIIERIKDLEKNHMSTYWERSRGYLDMSDEVDKIYAREYYLCKELLGKLKQITCKIQSKENEN